VTVTHAHSRPPQVEHRTFQSYDGTPIGFQVAGNPDGVPLLLANGLGGTFSAYRFIIHRFWDDFRFYCWDYRGMYSSGRPVSGYDGLSVECNARDGVYLMKEVIGADECFALGWSKGVQVALEMTRYEPSLIRGLVLHNGTAGRPYETLAGTNKLRDLMPRILRAGQRFDGLISRTTKWAVDVPWLIPLMTRTGMVNGELDENVFRDMAGNFRYLDMHLYVEALLRLGEHDAWDVLPQLTAPTLLIASTHDLMTPLSVMEDMASRIPDARLEIVPGGTHYAAVEFPELINRALERFFSDRFAELGIARS
jgi:pimeloyl-ACP methyl ester carboxylesterase